VTLCGLAIYNKIVSLREIFPCKTQTHLLRPIKTHTHTLKGLREKPLENTLLIHRHHSPKRGKKWSIGSQQHNRIEE
jgi:hypothetical protein